MNATTSIRRTICAAMCIAAASLVAQPATNLSADDRSAIQALVASYARALAECRAEEFAALFVPETGYFASGFRGHMAGKERLIALVKSERHCLAPAGETPAARPGGNAPTVELEVAANGARGVANLGMAEYQDEYTKTRDGWRFASRTVIVTAEKAAGLDARELLAIGKLGGSELGDYYETDQNGVRRLLTSGVRVGVADAQVTGRAYLRAGGYNDQVYEQIAPGEWRVKSSVYVPGEAR
jgi:SnoaL-like domain